jgi:D-threo-aldose 1-dehydrogenase
MQSPSTVARSVLGSSAVTVPRIGIGAGTLSNSDGPAALIGALEAGLRRGLNYVDTAPLYLDGGSERAVGEFVSGHQRGDIVLSTKVGRLADAPGPADAPGRAATGSRRRFDYSRRATLESVAASMARLRVDQLDAVIIHDVDAEMHPHFESSYRSAVGGCYPALAQLKRSGVIGAIGLSTRQPAVARRALSDVDLDLLMMAGAYTLLHHGPLAGLFPESQRRGVPVVIAAPFNSGILATGDPGSDHGQADPDVARRLDGLVAASRRHGVSLAAAALQFPLAHPAVASVVVGNRSAAELDRNAGALREPIPADFWRELKALGLIPADAPTAPDALEVVPDAL